MFSDDKTADVFDLNRLQMEEAIARLKKEKTQLIGEIRTMTEKILQETEDTLIGLDSFLEAN
jgi:hypothetical protein